MIYDCFLATRWRNREFALPLIHKPREKGKTIYSCFESKHNTELIHEDPEEMMGKFESTENWREDSYTNAVFKTDMDVLKTSTNLIMLLPAGKSSHIEAGIAYGLAKKCILVGEQKENESVYLVFDEHYDTIDDFIASID